MPESVIAPTSLAREKGIALVAFPTTVRKEIQQIKKFGVSGQTFPYRYPRSNGTPIDNRSIMVAWINNPAEGNVVDMNRILHDAQWDEIRPVEIRAAQVDEMGDFVVPYVDFEVLSNEDEVPEAPGVPIAAMRVVVVPEILHRTVIEKYLMLRLKGKIKVIDELEGWVNAIPREYLHNPNVVIDQLRMLTDLEKKVAA